MVGAHEPLSGAFSSGRKSYVEFLMMFSLNSRQMPMNSPAAFDTSGGASPAVRWKRKMPPLPLSAVGGPSDGSTTWTVPLALPPVKPM